MKQLIITGIRGLPASHGGFETFAEYLALHMVAKGWKVTVYCQETVTHFSEKTQTEWRGIQLINLPIKANGALGTIYFDWLSILDANTKDGIILTLGYNTALFNLLFRLNRKINLINMDGIEWKRDKWKWYEKAWLYLNERAGCLIGNHLIADHPQIQKHLENRVNPNKITMIPYGARSVTDANLEYIYPYQLTSKDYAILIARPEPENSILEIVSAFSAKTRGIKLVVLGHYNLKNTYHSAVLKVASNEVVFLGAIYDHKILDSLRFHAVFYIHGHTVGGTNPSLIEALGAGQPILAHNNKFNRWVAGEGSLYFNDTQDCELKLENLLSNSKTISQMSIYSFNRYRELFTWESILNQYEALISTFQKN